MTWEPGPEWQPVTPGTGQAQGGVWRTPDGAVAKRLIPGQVDPRHHAYWQRQALVAESGLVDRTPGLRAPECTAVERDADGITLRMVHVDSVPADPLHLAACLGRFAEGDVVEPAWGAQNVLRDRLRTVERRGGWSAHEEPGDLDASLRRNARALWVRRGAALAELDALPRVPVHGDAHPANLRGRDGADVVAIDWEQFGYGPAGFDLGYLLLAADRPLDELLTAYGDGPGLRQVRRGAVLTAALTAASRAAWALAQPDPGDHVERFARLGEVVAEAAGPAG
jgi:hypothetical protein